MGKHLLYRTESTGRYNQCFSFLTFVSNRDLLCRGVDYTSLPISQTTNSFVVNFSFLFFFVYSSNERSEVREYTTNKSKKSSTQRNVNFFPPNKPLQSKDFFKQKSNIT